MKEELNKWLDACINDFADDVAEQFGGDYDDNPNPDEEQRAKASLHSLLISKLPEKMVRSEIFEGESDGTIEAYNSAIDDMYQVIDEMFEVQK